MIDALSLAAPSLHPSTRLDGLAGRLLRLELSRGQAIAAAIALTTVIGAGDFVTTADVAFTIFYLVPIGVAVWFHSKRFGQLIALLCTFSSVVTDVYANTHLPKFLFMAWNNGVEFLLFLGFIAMIGVIRDRIEAEVALRRAAIDQLRHSERLNTIGKLASGIAHELGTPLHVIVCRSTLIQRGQVPAAESAKIIAQQAQRMAVIIRQLLDFSRRAGTGKSTTRLREFCDDTASLLQPLARESGVEFAVCGDEVEVEVNRFEIQQVLTNLLSNAVQAMPAGGKIEISIATERVTTPTEEGQRAGNYAVMAVRDQGSGIPVTVLPRIFDPFFTTKEVGKGTGLGLSVSYGIVRDHDGWMRVVSHVGEGTTFFVYLPR